jgi:hypothetical protein
MNLDQQLERDRALRDAAWSVVSDDVTWLQADLDHRSVGGRVMDRAGETAKELGGQSLDAAKRNKLAIGAVGAALVLWLARRPLAYAAKSLWANFRAPRPDADHKTGENDQ